jgi:hypothetical protein
MQSECGDAALVRRLANGCEETWIEFYRRHQDRIYRFVAFLESTGRFDAGRGDCPVSGPAAPGQTDAGREAGGKENRMSGMSPEGERRLDQALRDLAAWMDNEVAPARVEARLREEFRRRTKRRPSWPLWSAVAAAVIVAVVLMQPEPEPRQPKREIVTDFFPMRNAPVVEEELGQMIRVRVPRSALVRYGLAGGFEYSEPTVQADVVLGLDGTARAIRFVK